ncbi:hypothetical protein FB565_003764 [Actinoplanes lutulentus]|uniref:Uncharacterized protein n=1 Tax=Actinoplanes lutulentus TaxID=1287878 RepID=A0A327ZIQ7_9ACTN|nr:hypothetical protein [Actinoplanes lutulentus]MBB2944035.1 hypothetical protein [Actinoplanes lutulentus]RAK42732.1 hypothetical protein B0I29_102558 [Actinoplanes lutulentus]
MRRTALFLGGLFLATGASLALAGPAQAHDGNCKKDHGNAASISSHGDRGSAASIGTKGDRGYAAAASLGDDDDTNVIVINDRQFYRGHYYGGYDSAYWLGLGFDFHLGGGSTYYPGYGRGGWGWGFGGGIGIGIGGGFGGGGGFAYNAAV